MELWNTPFTQAIAQVAPYYNLLFVVIAVYLFIQLFKTYQPGGKVFLKPWIYICLAMTLFVLETLITILRSADLLLITQHINGYFELAIIILFIYAVLLQKEYIKNTYAAKPKAKKIN